MIPFTCPDSVPHFHLGEASLEGLQRASMRCVAVGCPAVLFFADGKPGALVLKVPEMTEAGDLVAWHAVAYQIEGKELFNPDQPEHP